jgi:hypothetical protein
MDFLAEPPFGPDAKAIAHQKHPDQQLWVNRRATSVAIEIGQLRSDAAQINKSM